MRPWSRPRPRPSKPATRRRRLEAFTIDSKIIRLISRRVAIFPAAAVRQIFDGDCDAANRKIISGVIPPNFRHCRFLDKWTEVFPVDKIMHRPMPLHWLSLRCFWSNLVTSVDLQLGYNSLPSSYFCTKKTLSFPHLQYFLRPRVFTYTKRYCSFISWVSARNQINYTYIHFCYYMYFLSAITVLRQAYTIPQPTTVWTFSIATATHR